jgi:ADP-ribose pyrophosphatase
VSRIVGREIAFTSPWMEVETLDVELPPPRGLETFYTVKTHRYVVVLAVTRDARVPLVRQYRPAVDANVLEFPSGHVDVGESPADAARRELLEETGCRAGEIISLGEMFVDSGRLQTRQESFFAADCDVVRSAPSGEEHLETVFVPASTLVELIARRDIRHASQLGAVAAAAARGLLPLTRS